MHFAAATGDTAQLAHFLKEKPVLLNKQDEEGKSPLMYAVTNNQLAGVELLLRFKAKVNHTDNSGQTALHLASVNGFTPILRALLDNGAKPTPKDHNGRIPLHLATGCKDTKCLNALLRTSPRNHANLQDKDGMAALHWAGFHKRPNHTKALLAVNAREDQMDTDQKTPLHWAAQNGSPMCVSLLLDSKSAALINNRDKDGNSCLHLAAAGGHHNVLKVLARVPTIDLNMPDNNGRTALHWSSAAQYHKCVSALLSFGCHPEIRDKMGSTAMDYALERGKDSDITTALEDARVRLKTGSYILRQPDQAIGADLTDEDLRKAGRMVGLLTRAFKKKGKVDVKVAAVKSKAQPGNAAAISPSGVPQLPPVVAGHNSKNRPTGRRSVSRSAASAKRSPSAKGVAETRASRLRREKSSAVVTTRLAKRKSQEEVIARRKSSATVARRNRAAATGEASSRRSSKGERSPAAPAAPVTEADGTEGLPSRPGMLTRRHDVSELSKLERRRLSRTNSKDLCTTPPLPAIVADTSHGGEGTVASEEAGVGKEWSPPVPRKNLTRSLTRMEDDMMAAAGEEPPPPLQKRGGNSPAGDTTGKRDGAPARPNARPSTSKSLLKMEQEQHRKTKGELQAALQMVNKWKAQAHAMSRQRDEAQAKKAVRERRTSPGMPVSHTGLQCYCLLVSGRSPARPVRAVSSLKGPRS